MYAMLDVSTSALVAHRTTLDVIAGNIAMKDITHMEDGKAIPFRRRVVLLSPGNPGARDPDRGVHVASVVEDSSPFGLRYDPGHVDAIKSGPKAGYVLTSNVDYHTEMVNAMIAQRAYEANVTVIEAFKSLARSTMRLIA